MTRSRAPPSRQRQRHGRLADRRRGAASPTGSTSPPQRAAAERSDPADQTGRPAAETGSTPKPPRPRASPARPAAARRTAAARPPRRNGACIGTAVAGDVTSKPRRRRRTSRRRRASSSGPISVISSAAASSALPTSRLASRCEYQSIGPATGTPLSCAPAAEVLDGRQHARRGSTVSGASRHPRMAAARLDSATIDRTEADAVAGPEQRTAPRATGRTGAPASGRSCASRRASRSDRCRSARRRSPPSPAGTRVRGVARRGSGDPRVHRRHVGEPGNEPDDDRRGSSRPRAGRSTSSSEQPRRTRATSREVGPESPP